MGKKVEIIPSIASANQLCIADEIRRIGAWKKLHIDIEDGNFVSNITFGEKTVRAIAAVSPQELDAHLLVSQPEQYLDMLKICGVSKIAVHIEALTYPLEVLNLIRDMGISPGLALNFMTAAEILEPFKEEVDYVIAMTAEPDSCGNQFYEPMLRKVIKLREILPGQVEIWADGGINEGNMREVIEAGATTLIMGRCVFGKTDPYAEMCRLAEYPKIVNDLPLYLAPRIKDFL